MYKVLPLGKLCVLSRKLWLFSANSGCREHVVEQVAKGGIKKVYDTLLNQIQDFQQICVSSYSIQKHVINLHCD